MAKLYFRYGAMNSGKSTGLLQAAFNYEERGQRVLLAKPDVDTKGDADVVSRLGMTRVGGLPDPAPARPSGSCSPPTPTGTIPTPCWSTWTPAGGVPAGGRGAVPRTGPGGRPVPHRRPGPASRCWPTASAPTSGPGRSPGSLRLLEVAHTLEELKTICRCGRKAIFNTRRVGNAGGLRRRPGRHRRPGRLVRVAVRVLLPRGLRRTAGQLRADPRPARRLPYYAVAAASARLGA